jgi:hypothetical protein
MAVVALPADLNTLRHAHESDAEWKLREGFLKAHTDSYSAKRLLCLASCFINVECYGATYPEGVMEELFELKSAIQDLIDEHETIKQLTAKGRDGDGKI